MAAEAGSGGVVKHILLARFKEDVAPERLDQLIRGYAGLVDLVPSMKAFHWLVFLSSHPPAFDLLVSYRCTVYPHLFGACLVLDELIACFEFG
jgi:hypothetical protein